MRCSTLNPQFRELTDKAIRRGVFHSVPTSSPHIIDTRFAATGDGIAAALMTLRELGGRDLAPGAEEAGAVCKRLADLVRSELG